MLHNYFDVYFLNVFKMLLWFMREPPGQLSRDPSGNMPLLCGMVMVEDLVEKEDLCIEKISIKFSLKHFARLHYSAQRAGIAAGGIFYNVQPGTAAQLKN
jgi:hypothetical protein